MIMRPDGRRLTRAALTVLGGVALVAAMLVATPGTAHAANATILDLDGVSTSAVTGVGDPFTVTMRDNTSAVDAGYTGTVTFSASCGDCFTVTPNNGGADAKKYTFVGGDAGTKAFTLTWTTAGTNRTFLASGTRAGGGAPIEDSQSGINVSAAPATSVELTNVDHDITINTVDPINVTLKDGSAVDTAYTGTVTFSADCGDCFTITPNKGAGADAKRYTFVGGDAGSREFNLTWTDTGTHALTVSATLASGGPATDTESNINVTTHLPSTVEMTGVEPSIQTHTPDTFTVAIKNRQGEPFEYGGNMEFSTPNCPSNPFTVTPNKGPRDPGRRQYTFKPEDHGTKSFTLTWTAPGTCTFRATALNAIVDPPDGAAFAQTSVTASNRPAVRVIVTGAAQGGGPHVQALRVTDLSPVHSFFAYTPGFLGGVNVASGDVDGDGWDDIITGAGPGGGPHVRVFNGVSLAEMYGWMVYGPEFSGGVSVAAGDVNGDGKADVITAPGSGGGPHVRVLSGADGSELFGFMAYAPNFTNGVNIAAANLDADAAFEIVTGAGAGGGPHVRYVEANGSDLAGSPAGGFMAYAPGFTGGVFVGAHRDSSNIARIATGAGPGGGRHLRVFNTSAIELLGRNVGAGTDGVVPTLGNIDGDNDDEILVSNVRANPLVQRFDLNGLELNAFAPYNAGVGVRTAVGTL